MTLGGYTGIPDSLEDAQQFIVTLLDEQKRSMEEAGRRLHINGELVAMIESARAALNAVEKPAQ